MSSVTSEKPASRISTMKIIYAGVASAGAILAFGIGYCILKYFGVY